MLYTSKHKGSVIDNAVDKMIALIVDSSLSTTSANPVQNKAIALELNTKLSNKTGIWQNDQNSLPRIYFGDASVTDDVIFRAAKDTTSYFELRKADNTVKFRVDMSTGALSIGSVPWSLLSSVPSSFTPAVHTHLWADLTDKPTTFTPSTHSHAWADITSGVPATFTPSAHDHGSFNRASSALTGAVVFSDFTISKGLITALNTRSLTYTDVGAAAAVHTHEKSSITDFPTSMPASDVSAWAKAATKPAYTPSEVGAAPAVHNHDSTYLGKTEKAADSDLLDGNHASTFAAASHGHSSFTRPVGTNVSPDSQSLMLNGSVSNNSDIVNAPGLGFHIPGINWMTLKMASDSSLRAYNSALNGYVPFFASAFYEDGVAISAKYAPLLSYPVGAIYMSYASTSPATLFGGTWSALPTGRFLRMGTGGSTGGSDTHAHTTAAMALTRAQLPAIDMNPGVPRYGNVAINNGGPISGYMWYGVNATPNGYYVGGMDVNLGSGSAHGHGDTGSASNVPAYYEVYAWRRTA